MHTPLPRLEVLSVEGQRAADQRVEDDAQTPDVHLGPVVFLALEELRGGVRRGAAERVQLVPQGELVAEAEVGYFDVHVCVQQQVLGLQMDGVKKQKQTLIPLTLTLWDMEQQRREC